MANIKWDKLKKGDFFSVTLNSKSDLLLYQKIKQTENGYNAILINTGDLCQLYISTKTMFEKVEVTFSLKPTN